MRGLCVLTLLVVYVSLVDSQIHHGHSHGFDGHHLDSGLIGGSGLLTDSSLGLGSSLVIGRRRPLFRGRQLNSISLFPSRRRSLLRGSGAMYNNVGYLSRGYPIYRRNSLRERRLTAENKRLMRKVRRLRRKNRKHMNELYDHHY